MSIKMKRCSMGGWLSYCLPPFPGPSPRSRGEGSRRALLPFPPKSGGKGRGKGGRPRARPRIPIGHLESLVRERRGERADAEDVPVQRGGESGARRPLVQGQHV